jgi:hypothetical protein
MCTVLLPSGGNPTAVNKYIDIKQCGRESCLLEEIEEIQTNAASGYRMKQYANATKTSTHERGVMNCI